MYARHVSQKQNDLFLISPIVERKPVTVASDDQRHPRYPLDEAVRHVESMEDIAKINAFTASLVDHAKL